MSQRPEYALPASRRCFAWQRRFPQTACSRCGCSTFAGAGDARFCADCGHARSEHGSRVCASCGAPVEATFRFCGVCGASLAGDPPIAQETSGERPAGYERQPSTRFPDDLPGGPSGKEPSGKKYWEPTLWQQFGLAFLTLAVIVVIGLAITVGHRHYGSGQQQTAAPQTQTQQTTPASDASSLGANWFDSYASPYLNFGASGANVTPDEWAKTLGELIQVNSNPVTGEFTDPVSGQTLSGSDLDAFT